MAQGFTAAILDWARSKPADGRYNYTSNDNCAVCQFLRETGRARRPLVAGNEWCDAGGPWHTFDERVDRAANSGWASQETFGAFADRLAAMVAA